MSCQFKMKVTLLAFASVAAAAPQFFGSPYYPAPYVPAPYFAPPTFVGAPSVIIEEGRRPGLLGGLVNGLVGGLLKNVDTEAQPAEVAQ